MTDQDKSSPAELPETQSNGNWDSNPAPPRPSGALASSEDGLEMPGDQKRCHPDPAAPPPPLGETSQTGLSPGACAPSPTLPPFMLVVEGIVFTNSLVLHSFN